MNRTIDTYRTADGAADYCFSFEEQADGNWRAYIVAQPDYGDLPDSASQTHRLVDNDGRRYVCWTNPLRTIEDAKAVASRWADETQKYRQGLPAFERS